MERHELDIYIEFYKRKQFHLIPVHKDDTGYYFLFIDWMEEFQDILSAISIFMSFIISFIKLVKSIILVNLNEVTSSTSFLSISL